MHNYVCFDQYFPLTKLDSHGKTISRWKAAFTLHGIENGIRFPFNTFVSEPDKPTGGSYVLSVEFMANIHFFMRLLFVHVPSANVLNLAKSH